MITHAELKYFTEPENGKKSISEITKKSQKGKHRKENTKRKKKDKRKLTFYKNNTYFSA